MLSLGVARRHLSRVSTKSISRTQARKSYSTKPPSSNSMKYTAGAGVFSTTLGFLWLKPTHDDDVPCLENLPAEQLGIEPGPSEDQVTNMISQEAYSHLVRNITGVERYDGAQLASNNPCEDQFTHGKFPSPYNDENPWIAWGVFDGHIGWQTSELLKRQLLPYVQHSLGQIGSLNNEPLPEELVQRAIKQGFLNLDDCIFKTALDTIQSNEPLQDKVKKIVPSYAGSCALLSVYDPITSTLHVACTGDSRAVLGQQGPDGKWEAIPLSVDQTGSNQEEITRVQNEHPGETEIVKDGRVLGLMVSRSFGDGQWKWPLDMQHDLKQRFNGPAPLTPRYNVQTPPYLTAESVVTSTKINPNNPSFLVMATDGMWDTVSNEQAVDLVGKWIESQATGKKYSKPEPSYDAFDFGHFWKGVDWKFVDERTTVQDENAAVHLVRNSLGGNHHGLISGRLAFSAPQSRRVRDDITVQVVFFNTPGLKTT